MDRPPAPSRRSFLLAGAVALGAAACGDDDTASSAGTTTTEASTTAAETYSLIEVFPRNPSYLAAGFPQRLPYLIAPGEDAPLDRIEGSVSFAVTLEGTPVGEPVEVVPGGGAPLPRAYLPFRFTFPEPGLYDVVATWGDREMGTAVQVSDPSQVRIPQVGAAMPSVDTPTTSDARGVDPICTADEQCPFHGTNLADSLSAGRPVVVLLSTPKFCVSQVCGPVLEVLTDATAGRTDIDVIHVEPYANPLAVDSIAQATPSAFTTGYHMEFEPALFAANAAGVLVARLDSIYDTRELDEALTLATG